MNKYLVSYIDNKREDEIEACEYLDAGTYINFWQHGENYFESNGTYYPKERILTISIKSEFIRSIKKVS